MYKYKSAIYMKINICLSSYLHKKNVQTTTSVVSQWKNIPHNITLSTYGSLVTDIFNFFLYHMGNDTHVISDNQIYATSLLGSVK